MSNLTQFSDSFMNGAMLIACKAEVLAPESTRALMKGIDNSGNVHHSSEPNIIFFSFTSSCGMLAVIKNHEFRIYLSIRKFVV